MPEPWVKVGSYALVKQAHNGMGVGSILKIIKCVHAEEWGQGEVIYCAGNASQVGRILNFGYTSCGPVTRDVKRELFERKVADVDKALQQKQKEKDALMRRIDRLKRFSTDAEEKKELFAQWKALKGTEDEREAAMMAELENYIDVKFADLE